MNILHVGTKNHKCVRTIKTMPASYVKAGEMLGLGEWNLFYHTRQHVYIVHRNDKIGDSYQFRNFNCAVAKLESLAA